MPSTNPFFLQQNGVAFGGKTKWGEMQREQKLHEYP